MISQNNLNFKIKLNEPISKHTTWKLGGNSLFFSSPTNSEELLSMLDFVQKENVDYYLLGKGSNVLFPDEGFPGMVINMTNFEKDYFKIDGETVEVSAGMSNLVFIKNCAEHGLGGLEFLASIPGTLGGSVVQNAGFSRIKGQSNEIGDYVEEVVVITRSGELKNIFKEDIAFSYRDSNLRDYIVIRVKLKGVKSKKELIQNESTQNFEYRKRVQDLQHPTSGSVFKNPKELNFSSGQLIEKVGLKGHRIGGAQISEKHANFFINIGNAKASEMMELIKLAKNKVFEEFGVWLEEEVRCIR